MRIEFDPTNPTEAAAVRAMLTALAPTEVRLTGSPLDGGVLSAKIGDLALATARVASDPWHQGTTVMTATGDIDPIKVPEGTRFYPVVTEDPSSLVNCDSNGEPHDPRIHSTPATTNKDGTWRAKRGVTAEQIAQVKAEREASATEEAHIPIIDSAGVAAAFEEDVVVPVARVTVTENLETGESTISLGAGQPAPTAPPAPPAPTGQSEAPLPPNAGPVAEQVTPEPQTASGTATVLTAPRFLDVMKAITAAQKDGKIDTAKVKELCAAVGAGESTMGLNGPDNGDKRGAFMALLSAESGE